MVGTGHLDGLAQFYTTTIDFDVELLGDGVGHQRSSDGTEEHALLAHLGDNAHGGVVQLLGQSVGIGNASLLALGDVLLALLKLLQVARGSLHGIALGQQEGNGIGHESHDAGALNSFRDVALVLGAGTGHATGLDLATIGNVLAQHLSIFVIDILHVVLAELAILTTRLLSVIGHINLFRFA